MRRVERFAAQLQAPAGSKPGADASVTVHTSGTVKNELEELEGLYAVLEKRMPGPGEYDISQHIAGPLSDTRRYPKGWVDVFKDSRAASLAGEPHVLHQRWQEEYGDQGLSTNIVVPSMIVTRSEGDTGTIMPPFLTQEVIIGHPDDAARLARTHVKKQPNFTPALYDSLISTVDNVHWSAQREQLTPAFLPQASLSQIYSISAERAAHCAARLREQSDNGTIIVDMHDFLLYETQAQLQLALFGESPEFMEATNERFRSSIGGSEAPGFVRPFCRELASHYTRPSNTCAAVPEDVAAGRCPIARGPLSAALNGLKGPTSVVCTPHHEASSGPPASPSAVGGSTKNVEGNTLMFAIAGHVTVGSSLAWVLFSLALATASEDQRERSLLPRLQNEVAAFFAHVGDRGPKYEDLQLLPFMTRCIMETLRLYPAVADGTFREIQFDDTITGPGGKQVPIKAGTYVRISNWSRHRNPALWEDAHKWNPDRHFEDAELWHGKALAGYNPASARFSPFTFTPRDCIGKNFAQMEMRLILANLLAQFSFELTPEFLARYDPSTYNGVNYGTLGPQDLTQDDYVEGFEGWSPKTKRPTGMPMKVVPR